MASWLNLTDARKFWKDAPADDVVLTAYLASARTEVEAFGEQQADPEVIPENWRMAQWQQARNTYNAGRAAAGGSDDGSSFGLVAMPLDWKIQQLIRPRRALGAIA